MNATFSLRRFVVSNLVPIIFLVFSAVAIPLSGLSPSYLAQEMVSRVGRNTFLVLSLLIPVMAGMGLNFGMVLGAMAGQIGLILAVDWGIAGIPGLELIQDRLDYFSRTAHTNMDFVDRAPEANLVQASTVLAALIYQAAMEEEPLPRRAPVSPAVLPGKDAP